MSASLSILTLGFFFLFFNSYNLEFSLSFSVFFPFSIIDASPSFFSFYNSINSHSHFFILFAIPSSNSVPKFSCLILKFYFQLPTTDNLECLWLSDFFVNFEYPLLKSLSPSLNLKHWGISISLCEIYISMQI